VRPEIALALTAGLVAAFNPCGFALLPTYLAVFVGDRGSRRSAVGRALVVGAAVTVGFVAVFGVVGALVAALSVSLGPWLSVVTVASGVLLLGLGGWLVTGREVSVRVPRARLTVSGSFAGMTAYGVVYATVSLSCTLPVFLAAVMSVFAAPDAGPLLGVGAMLAYAAGMGAVLTTLALVVGLAGQAAGGRLRSWTRYVGRVSGVLVLVAGAYVVWFGWVEWRTFTGEPVPAGPVVWVGTLSARASQAVSSAGPWWVLLVCAAVPAVVGAARVVARRRSGRTSGA
jgi:cytochrome c-type biogenesis protein